MRKIKIKEDKHGWIRIVEAFISVMIVMSVLLVVLARQPEFQPTNEEEIGKVQSHILNLINQDVNLRNVVYSEEGGVYEELINSLINTDLYSYEYTICPIDEVCPSSSNVALLNQEVFVEQTVLGASLQSNESKIFKLFFWETSCGNGLCDGSETCATCDDDCGECVAEEDCVDSCSLGDKDCSTDNKKRTICEEDVDSCLKWVSYKCGSEKECLGSSGVCTDKVEEEVVVEPTEASLSLTFSNVNYLGYYDGYYNYNYDRLFEEDNGVSVTLDYAELWLNSGKWNEGPVSYSISGSGSLFQEDKTFGTIEKVDKMTLKYFVDGELYVEQSICLDVDSNLFTPNC